MIEFMGCSVVRKKNNFYRNQWELIRRMEDSFLEEVKQSMKVYDTTGAPGVVILKLPEEEKKLKKETQTKYRSGVGMILFLVKYL